MVFLMNDRLTRGRGAGNFGSVQRNMEVPEEEAGRGGGKREENGLTLEAGLVRTKEQILTPVLLTPHSASGGFTRVGGAAAQRQIPHPPVHAPLLLLFLPPSPL